MAVHVEGSNVTLSVTISGGLFVKLLGSMIAMAARRNVRLEAEGLKRPSERGSRGCERGRLIVLVDGIL